MAKLNKKGKEGMYFSFSTVLRDEKDPLFGH
jgi:hypothetical protein